MVDKFRNLGLVRNSDIEALAPGSLKLANSGFQFFRRNLHQFVLQPLAGLQREQTVDNRRAAMGYRVAHDPIAINGGGLRYRIISHKSLP